MAKRTPDTHFKVVVLGASGVGKSSVLNALLDEGNLLPSSATGDACTAVPIEIHYKVDNRGGDVKAEIQYVTEDVWRKTVEEGKAEAEIDEDDHSDRGQGALKRISLVYSKLTDYEIIERSVDEIIATNDSKDHLGKCITIQASNRVDFSRDFKQQIGSVKRPGNVTWPMIDHVRLYIRHSLLENGLVLVDIPGMFETNQARVENATNYLQKCSAVLIMTHAARSNSDASQESLASRAFQQVQFDQRLDRVLYVCTKSDELDLQQTHDELDVPEAKPLHNQLKAAQQDRKRVAEEGDTLRLILRQQTKIAGDSGKDIQRWKRAQSKAEDDWNSFIPPGERIANGKFLKAEASDEAWDEEDVTDKIESLKQEKAAATLRSKNLRARIAANESRLKNIRADIDRTGLLTKQAVFKARNDQVKEHQAKRYIGAVKKYERDSFRAVKEIAELADDGTTQSANFDNIKEKVFCVSALAYSLISGLKRYALKEGAEVLKEDGNACFLRDVEDTEIPALARRLKHAALTERYRKLQDIQRKLRLAFDSLKERLLPEVQQKEIDVEAASQATQDFADGISRFLRDFGGSSTADAAIKEIYKKYFTDIIPRLETMVIPRIIKKIEPRSLHPGNGGNNKGLLPAEYKAVVHANRSGIYTGKRVLDNGDSVYVNFNDDAAILIKQCIHKMIQKVLISSRGGIKMALIEFRQNSETIMDKLHEEFRLRAMTVGVDLRRITSSDEKLQLRKQDLQQTFRDTLEAISKAHVSAARHLEKDIRTAWKNGYARAYLKFGTGARVAMSDELCMALDRDDVIKDVLNLLDRRISSKISRILVELTDNLTTMAKSIAADYSQYMTYRSQVVESTGHAGLDKVRNRMIALGYEDLKSAVLGTEEDVSDEIEPGFLDQEQVWDEMIAEATHTGNGVIKTEEPSELENGSS